MRVLVDTNLFLDVLLERPKLVDESERALNLFNSGSGMRGWISWHTLSNLYYIGSDSKYPRLPHLPRPRDQPKRISGLILDPKSKKHGVGTSCSGKESSKPPTRFHIERVS